MTTDKHRHVVKLWYKICWAWHKVHTNISQIGAREACSQACVLLQRCTYLHAYHCILKFNSLSPGKYGKNLKREKLKFIIQNSSLNTPCELAHWWMLWNVFNEMSTLVQVMAWCRQAPHHCLRQCWPRSLSSYGVTRIHWVLDRSPDKTA